MSRLVAAATVFLLTATTAFAQVLDDDLEFENHVATIELDEDSPVLAAVGPSREITYECHFEGTLYVSVTTCADADPFLRVQYHEASSSRRTTIQTAPKMSDPPTATWGRRR